MAEAALETGYKIADGIVTNQPEISFEGIVTSVYQTGLSGRRAWDSVAAAAAVANMQAWGILFGVQSVKTVTFAYTKNAPPAKNKSGDASASGKESSGKKSTETILPTGGIGIYPTFTHVDVRKSRTRWQGH